MLTAKFDQLVKQLRILPGVGQKSAQRMALHLLSKKRPQGMALAQALDEAMRDIVECQRCLSPIDGVSADDLNIDQLVWRVKQEPVEELILATGTTVEGQTTAHFISEAVNRHVNKVTRLAQGVPMGGELEYLDSMTLGQAMQNRSFL